MVMCVMIFSCYCVLAFKGKNYFRWLIPPGPPLFSDQTEAQRVEKYFLDTTTPPPPNLSQGLDLALI